jgi:hypothetical protein
MAITARQKQIYIAGALMMSAAAGGGLLIGILPRYQTPVFSGTLAIAVMIGVFLTMLPRWRMLDHMEQDSRLLSWYWGGGFGGSVGLVLVIVFAGVRSPLFSGAALIWLLQCMGYAVARFRWWLAHRSDAA